MVSKTGQWAKECIACQQYKIQTHIRAPMSKITVPTKRFTHIHIDLVGPLPRSEDYSYLLTTIDRTTRLPEAIPINKKSTSECAKTLIRHWISRFGVPLDMTSDRGPQFTSVLWNDIADKLGISTIVFIVLAHITLTQMGLRSDSTDYLKQRSKHTFTDPTGLTNSPGFSWALELSPRKILKHNLWNWFMASR